jgi:DNA-binding response OmpR family regulator
MQQEISDASDGSRPEEASQPQGRAPITSLLVSDASAITAGMKDFLKSQGHTVLAAVSAKDALEMTRRFQPTFILLKRDVDEGKACGLMSELLIEHSKAAVIMMSANPPIWEVVEAVKLGAVDYLLWPPDLKRLKNALDVHGELFKGR